MVCVGKLLIVVMKCVGVELVIMVLGEEVVVMVLEELEVDDLCGGGGGDLCGGGGGDDGA